METFWPAVFALSAALLWGLNAHVQRKALDDTDEMTGAFLTVAIGALGCWIAAPFLVDPSWWLSPETLIFAVVGIFVPAVGQRLQIASVGIVGASMTASLASFAPVFAVTIGLILFDEIFTPLDALGLALMICGLFLATWSPRGLKRGWPFWAVFLPLGAALVRGTSQPVIKLGMEGGPSPFYGLLIMSTVSTVLLGVLLLRAHREGRTTFGEGVRWFALNGVINSTALLSLNAALSFGAVTIASPLAATIPLWALFFGAFVFRRETLGLKHLFIALLVVCGGALIVAT